MLPDRRPRSGRQGHQPEGPRGKSDGGRLTAAYRVDASITPTGGAPIVNDVFNTHQRVHEVVAACQGNPRGRRPQRRLGARPAPEVRLSRRGALLQADRRVRALFRRRPRPRRAVPPGHSATAPDDHRARSPREKNGASAGTSTRWSKITTSITFASRCPTSAASRKW